jgi:hypothetical protein
MLSDKDKANLPPPTTPGFSAWLTAAQQRLDRLAHTPGTSLGDLEIAVVEDRHRLGASLLTQAANLQGQATPFLCSRCRGPLVREAGNQVRKIDSVVGPLHLGRGLRLVPKVSGLVAPRRCPMGPPTQCARLASRPRDGGRSGAQNALCAGRKVTPRLGGCVPEFHHSASRGRPPGTARAGFATGRSAAHHHGRRESFNWRNQSAPPQKPFVLILELDAWNIRERTDWGRTERLRKKGKEPERWHWVYTATIFRLDQRGHTAAKRPVITERGFVATRAGLEAFEGLVLCRSAPPWVN